MNEQAIGVGWLCHIVTTHIIVIYHCVYVYVFNLSAAYGWVRETPEGIGMYIEQETITAEEGETIQLTIFYTKNADLAFGVLAFNIVTAGTATRM